jgi:hypothetical protein
VKINWDELSPEQILAKAKELEQESAGAASEIESLNAKRTELLQERARQKRVLRALTERGLDTKAKDFDEKLAELLVEVDEFKEKGQPTEGTPPATPPTPGQSGVPSDLNPEIKAMLERMTNQISSLTEQNEQAKKREEQLQKEMEFSNLKATVIEKLKNAGAEKPEHVFALTQDKYRLAEDKKTVLGGDEYDPVSVDTIVENLKNGDDFGFYFKGSGNTGSGFQGKSSSPANSPYGVNPFVKGGNSTEAAALYQSNPERAKMLLIQAKNAGTIDPTMDRAFLSKG